MAELFRERNSPSFVLECRSGVAIRIEGEPLVLKPRKKRRRKQSLPLSMPHQVDLPSDAAPPQRPIVPEYDYVRPRPVLEPEIRTVFPFGLGAAEGLAALTIAYFVCAAAFNAGYFDRVPARFVELFSFTDLLTSNISILQYFISIFTAYCMVSFFGSWIFRRAWLRAKPFVERELRLQYNDPVLYLLALGVLVGLFFIYLSILAALGNTSFTLEYLAWIALYGFFVYFIWLGHNFGFMSLRNTLFWVSINVLFFANITGYNWLKYDIRNQSGSQTIILKDGPCIDRKILRRGSNGYLLYNFYLRQFEFRSKDEVKTIFDRSGCM
jgi:hypothetical protein